MFDPFWWESQTKILGLTVHAISYEYYQNMGELFPPMDGENFQQKADIF